MSIFDVNSPFFQFLNKLADVIVLGLLWLLFCVPLVTIGASTTSFVSVLMDMQRDLEGNIYYQFTQRFRIYFKRSTYTWLFFLILLGWISFDIHYCLAINTKLFWFFLPILVILCIMLVQTYVYTWALIPNSSQPLKKIWKSAVNISMTYLPHSLCITFFGLLCIFIVSYAPWTTLIVIPMIFYQYARIFVWIFTRDSRLRPLLDLWDEGVHQNT